MANKTRTLLVLVVLAAPLGCSYSGLREDFGEAVHKNKMMQVENISAPQESHPEVKMDGQKAADVVQNYRKEKPQVEDTKLLQ